MRLDIRLTRLAALRLSVCHSELFFSGGADDPDDSDFRFRCPPLPLLTDEFGNLSDDPSSGAQHASSV